MVHLFIVTPDLRGLIFTIYIPFLRIFRKYVSLIADFCNLGFSHPVFFEILLPVINERIFLKNEMPGSKKSHLACFCDLFGWF